MTPPDVQLMLAQWLAEYADQGVFTTDEGLRVTSWNTWLERRTGRKPQDVVGRLLLEVYPDLAERHLDLLYRDALGGHGSMLSTALHRYLLRLPITGGGQETLQRARIVPAVVDGRIVGTITVIDDVSERVTAERELRRQVIVEHEARTRQALLVKLTGALLTGTHDEAALGRLVFETIGPAIGADVGFNYRLDPASGTLHLVASTGVPSAHEEGARRLALNQAFCGTVAATSQPLLADAARLASDPLGAFARGIGLTAYVCHPLQMRNGQTVGTLSFASTSREQFSDEDVAFMQTVSHFVALAWERRQVLAELEASDKRKDEFLALLAHELRNPLAPIRTSMGVMRARGTADPALARCRDIIDRQVTQMSRLLDDLLDVSRLSRGKLTLRPTTVRLADVLETAVETARPIIDDRRHTLHLHGLDSAIMLDADKARLTQVFANLLNNAAKYTDPGGRIDVIVQRHHGSARVTVRDTGMGIEPELRPRVFELFTQAGHAREMGEGGLGIGLALAQRLVEMHDGTIEAHSGGRGHGSEFVVTLPMVSTTRVPDRSNEPTAMAAASMRRRVLIADDNADAADTLAMLLEDLGCEVRTVYDGTEAIREAQSFRPDVILLDLGMPGVSGQTVCHRLRGEAWAADAIIVAVTGLGQDEDRRRTKISGFDHHLVKPVDTAVLVELVRDRRQVSGLPPS